MSTGTSSALHLSFRPTDILIYRIRLPPRRRAWPARVLLGIAKAETPEGSFWRLRHLLPVHLARAAGRQPVLGGGNPWPGPPSLPGQ